MSTEDAPFKLSKTARKRANKRAKKAALAAADAEEEGLCDDDVTCLELHLGTTSSAIPGSRPNTGESQSSWAKIADKGQKRALEQRRLAILTSLTSMFPRISETKIHLAYIEAETSLGPEKVTEDAVADFLLAMGMSKTRSGEGGKGRASGNEDCASHQRQQQQQPAAKKPEPKEEWPSLPVKSSPTPPLWTSPAPSPTSAKAAPKRVVLRIRSASSQSGTPAKSTLSRSISPSVEPAHTLTTTSDASSDISLDESLEDAFAAQANTDSDLESTTHDPAAVAQDREITLFFAKFETPEEAASAMGFVFYRTGKHRVLKRRLPTGIVQTFIFPVSPSDHRNNANSLRDLRKMARAGGLVGNGDEFSKASRTVV